MFAYIVRRVLYAIPILIGVNLLTFALFFVVNTPDDMARMQLGAKRVTPEAVEKWKAERGYNLPLVWNAKSEGAGAVTQTVFFQKSVRLFVFDFGYSEDKRDIGGEIATRMWPSLALALPVFLVGLAVCVTFALLMAFFRATYLDLWGVVLCVAMMSISTLFYIIGGQYIASKLWHLVPISGYAGGFDAWKFLILPVLIGVISGIGASSRWYRTLFLEEMGKDYVRTARAKGLGERVLLARHVLKNALLPVTTLIGLQLSYLLGGTVIVEIVFAWPGIGSLVVDAILARDYPVVQGVALLVASLVVVVSLVVDLSYAVLDPRVRLG